MQGEVVNLTHPLTRSFTLSAVLPFCRSSRVEATKNSDINRMRSLPSGACAGKVTMVQPPSGSLCPPG